MSRSGRALERSRWLMRLLSVALVALYPGTLEDAKLRERLSDIRWGLPDAWRSGWSEVAAFVLHDVLWDILLWGPVRERWTQAQRRLSRCTPAVVLARAGAPAVAISGFSLSLLNLVYYLDSQAYYAPDLRGQVGIERNGLVESLGYQLPSLKFLHFLPLEIGFALGWIAIFCIVRGGCRSVAWAGVACVMLGCVAEYTWSWYAAEATYAAMFPTYDWRDQMWPTDLDDIAAPLHNLQAWAGPVGTLALGLAGLRCSALGWWRALPMLVAILSTPTAHWASTKAIFWLSYDVDFVAKSELYTSVVGALRYGSDILAGLGWILLGELLRRWIHTTASREGAKR